MRPFLLAAAALFLSSPTLAPPPAALPYDMVGGEQWCLSADAATCANVSLGGVPAPLLPPTPPPPVVRPVTEGVRLVVSLGSQRLYVFADGDYVTSSPVSTGKRGHATPAGTFRVIEKQVHHRSNKYSNAPMPYMQRLTMSGVAIHAGHLPGYPASHGCIRVPTGFAKRLYGITDRQTTVTIVRARPKSAEAAFAFAQAI